MGTKMFFLKGVAFIAAARYSGILVNLLVTSILARLLLPVDFGVIAISTVFIVFFSFLSNFGIGPAIIQFKQLTQDDFRSIFGMSFWVAVVLAFAFFLLAPLIAFFYEQPILTNICRWLSLQVFFTTFNIVPNSLLLREKKFNIIAYRNVSIQLLCGTLAVWAAFTGWGIYALIITPILSAIITLIVNVYYMKLSIRFKPDIAPMKLIFSYSVYQFLFDLVNYFGRNLDKLIIGKFINVAQLGYYEKSYRLMLMPIENINGVLSPVLLPYLSESQNNLGKILLVYSRMTRILIYISFPLAAFLFCCSEELILLVFGSQWLEAIPCFTILTLSVATQIPTYPAGSVLQACNQTKILFKLGNINVAITILGLLIAVFVFGTIESIAFAFVITAFLVAVNTLYTIYNRCFHTSMRVVLFMVIKPLLLSVVIIVVLKLLEYLVPMPFLLSLFTKCIFWLFMLFMFFQNFTEYKPLSYLSKLRKL
jgi:teichuronic acid exporter